MTRYTRIQGFPYPASEKEYGNAGAQLEELALKVDTALDSVAAAWTTLAQPGRILHQLGANQTIAGGSTLVDITPPGNFSILDASSNATNGTLSVPYGGVGSPPNASQRGWWDCSIHVATQPSGTVTTGSRRYLQAQKVNYGNYVDDDVNVFVAEDIEYGSGVTMQELNFMTRLDGRTFGVFVQLLHNNASSLTLLAGLTWIEAIQVTGVVS